MSVNKKYKDSVFTKLFRDEQTLRELYNAVTGSNYDSTVPVALTTLSDTLFMDRMNDISFTIDGKLVVFMEHQSTVNKNMPIRFLIYAARIYETLIDNKVLYQKHLHPLPRPEFYVFYNGTESLPEESILKLSDAFIEVAGNDEVLLELTVKVLNVNLGQNERIAQKNSTLHEYSAFIDKIRENNKSMSLEAAVIAAIKYCRQNDVLKSFLEKHSSEVINMLTAEWNLEDAIAVAREEEREEAEERFEEERQRFEAAWQRAETERQRAEAERQKFIALLRTAGISDEQIALALHNSTN